MMKKPSTWIAKVTLAAIMLAHLPQSTFAIETSGQQKQMKSPADAPLSTNRPSKNSAKSICDLVFNKIELNKPITQEDEKTIKNYFENYFKKNQDEILSRLQSETHKSELPQQVKSQNQYLQIIKEAVIGICTIKAKFSAKAIIFTNAQAAENSKQGQDVYFNKKASIFKETADVQVAYLNKINELIGTNKDGVLVKEFNQRATNNLADINSLTSDGIGAAIKAKKQLKIDFERIWGKNPTKVHYNNLPDDKDESFFGRFLNLFDKEQKAAIEKYTDLKMQEAKMISEAKDLGVPYKPSLTTDDTTPDLAAATQTSNDTSNPDSQTSPGDSSVGGDKDVRSPSDSSLGNPKGPYVNNDQPDNSSSPDSNQKPGDTNGDGVVDEKDKNKDNKNDSSFYEDNKAIIWGVGGAAAGVGGYMLADKYLLNDDDNNKKKKKKNSSNNSSSSSSSSTSQPSSQTAQNSTLKLTTGNIGGVSVGGTLPAISVKIVDPQGVDTKDSLTDITVICASPKPCSITGTMIVKAQNGTATFSDLKFTSAHTGVYLQFTAPGMQPVNSTSFDVSNSSSNGSRE